MKLFYFYILFSQATNKYYIGHTSYLTGRLRRHNTNHKGYTGIVNDWEIVYVEEFQSKTEAYQRERQVKGWKNRRKVEGLIS